MSSRYPENFAARWRQVKENRWPIRVNCVSTALYLLDCIAKDSYVPLAAGAVHKYLKRIVQLDENTQIKDFPEAQVLGIWDPAKTKAGQYVHLAVFPPDDLSGWVYERAGFEGPAQTNIVYRLLRDYKVFDTREAFLLKKK